MPPGIGRLGEYANRSRSAKAAPARQAVPARPAVVDDGVELEIVWHPHRDAVSLIGDIARNTSAECRLALQDKGRF